MNIPGYRIVREIGRGGMSTVYLAVQESLERQVALKVMSHGLASNEAFKNRFLNEGRIVAHLNHRNIVTIYDIGVVDDVYFIAMEYVVGRNLSERISEGLTQRQSIKIVRRIARGLNHAHTRGFIHRDIKPSNILFRDDRDAVLADFGIAKSLHDAGGGLTVTGLTPGTPNYMSPDQLRGLPLDGRSDLYSLGVVFYEMLTGSRPFQADTGIAVALRHINDPAPELPDELRFLQPIMSRLLAKEPSERFSNAAELIRALDHIIADHAIVAARDIDRTTVNPEPTHTAPDAAHPKDSSTRVAAREIEKTIREPEPTRIEPHAIHFENEQTRFDKPSSTAAEPATQFRPVPSILASETRASAPNSKKSRKKPLLWSMAVGGVAVIAGLIITPWASRELDDYRQEQLTVERLLEMADEQFTAERLFEPKGENAYRTYQQILAIEPGHSDALEGMTRIADKVEQDARAARSFGNLTESLALVRQGLSADPDHEGLLDLRKHVAGQIRAQRDQQRIDRLLAEAARDIEQGRLVQPSGNNAYEAFREVLRMAPRNADALAGIELIATRFQERAQARQTEGELEAGLSLVNQGLALKPGHEGLSDLRQQIDKQIRQEQERRRIAMALDRATAHLETGQLIAPSGDNALEAYQWILSKDHDNQQALAGITEIAQRVMERARAALRSGNYEQALAQTNRAIQALPGRADLLTMRTAITSAQQTHQQQMRISALLKQGQEQIADGKYLDPPDDNFLQTYKSIRALDPTNVKAKQDVRKVAAHFLAQAQEAKSAGEAEQALAAVSDGLRFVPQHPALLELQTEIYGQQQKELERERSVAELLQRAKSRMSAGRLMVPEADSAYATYQEVLKRDPRNEIALRGIAEIAARMHQKAREKYADGALAKSLALAELGLQAKPRDENLTTLERKIQAQINEKRLAEEKNKRIAELLALANQQLAALKLTRPTGDNALESYRQVLSLDATNEQAKGGLREVIRRYAEIVKTKLENGKLQEGLAMAERGLTVEPEYGALRSLRDEIVREISKQEARKRNKLSQLLATAQQGLEAERLTSPQGYNAFEAYQEVLEIDPGNQRAQDGLRAISDHYAEMAKEMRDGGQLEEGLKLAALGLRVYPDNSYLNALQAEIQAALRAEADRAQALEKLYMQAQQQIDEQKLMQPPGDNAYETSRAILQLDPNSSRAAQIREQILSQYESLARARQRDGALQKSLAFVEQGLEIDPENARLVALRKNLTREIEAARQAKLDAQATPAVKSVTQPAPAPEQAPEEEDRQPTPLFGTF